MNKTYLSCIDKKKWEVEVIHRKVNQPEALNLHRQKKDPKLIYHEMNQPQPASTKKNRKLNLLP